MIYNQYQEMHKLLYEHFHQDLIYFLLRVKFNHRHAQWIWQKIFPYNANYKLDILPRLTLKGSYLCID